MGRELQQICRDYKTRIEFYGFISLLRGSRANLHTASLPRPHPVEKVSGEQKRDAVNNTFGWSQLAVTALPTILSSPRECAEGTKLKRFNKFSSPEVAMINGDCLVRAHDKSAQQSDKWRKALINCMLRAINESLGDRMLIDILPLCPASQAASRATSLKHDSRLASEEMTPTR